MQLMRVGGAVEPQVEAILEVFADLLHRGCACWLSAGLILVDL